MARDYARARKLVDVAPSTLEAPTLTLLRGFLALQDQDPKHAIEHFEQLGESFRELDGWVDELRADALALTADYAHRLRELTVGASFARSMTLTERLLADERFAQAEQTLALAQSKSSGEEQAAQVHWLRARLRLASGRAGSAHADVRWLVVSHPNHPESEAAFAAVGRGQYQALSTNEYLARAEAAAELGLLPITEQSIALALTNQSLRFPEGEQAYLRGLAYYRARRFSEAVGPLDEAVRMQAARRDRARYLAAVATSRSGAGPEALRRFEAIANSKPVTENVENASFALGREQSLLGNWTNASERFTAFVTQFPNHELTETAYRERLVAWFGEGNYKRFIYWVRQFRGRYPNSKEGLLLRSLEALALFRLGHPEQARPIWEDLARAAPLAFVGIAARARLKGLGIEVTNPIRRNTELPTSDPRLPEVVAQLELAGLSEQSELAFRKLESVFVRPYAPNGSAVLCEATAKLERGRRRFELGRGLAVQRGVKDAPALAPPWLWPCLFPSPHQTSVAEHSQTHHVAPALIYAVMRQESGFQVDALSSAGARGLMQIIDPTARRIASELGRPFDASQLEVAHYNIEYGAFYLNKLQTHFRHPALVAAAYNAGPDAAARWYAAGRALPLEAFIARIPYDETRSYVQRVLENLVAYQTLLDTKPADDITLEFAAPQADGALTDAAPTDTAMHRAPDGFY